MNTNDNKDVKYQDVSKTLNQVICNNLKQLIEVHQLSQGDFCKELAEKKTSISRSHLVNILTHPENHSISAAFLLSCCDYFGITLNDLVSTDFNISKYINNEYSNHQEYINIQKLLQKYERITANQKTVAEKSIESVSYLGNNIPNLFSLFKSTDLISDPSSIQFSGYLQDYYCYYYPTHSSENKKNVHILKGVLSLTAEDNFCRSTLKIDTNTMNDNGETNYKEYTGYAVISTSVNSVNCIMYSDSLCEFCFIMFRYFKINFHKLECRIAEVLSSSSAAEERRPTVLRMFLSQEKISDKDLELISPAFSLNYSTIITSKQDLLKLAQLSEDYKAIVDDLIKTVNSKEMLFCRENDVINLGIKHLNSKKDATEFLMHLRASSYSYRYNKVGAKADKEVRRLLLSRGYFKRNSSDTKNP